MMRYKISRTKRLHAGCPARTGLAAGLNCTRVDNGRFDTFTCGNTKCSQDKKSGAYSCITSVHNNLITGSGMDNMKQEMATLNNEYVSNLIFPV